MWRSITKQRLRKGVTGARARAFPGMSSASAAGSPPRRPAPAQFTVDTGVFVELALHPFQQRPDAED